MLKGLIRFGFRKLLSEIYIFIGILTKNVVQSQFDFIELKTKIKCQEIWDLLNKMMFFRLQRLNIRSNWFTYFPKKGNN